MNMRSGVALSPRTESLALRIDPQMKYLAELAAREQRRSLTSLVEWAIHQALENVTLPLSAGPITAAGAKDLLWDIDDVERFRKLAERCPSLLSYDEQVLLNVISTFATDDRKSLRFVENSKTDWNAVRACWVDLNAHARGENGSSERLSASLRIIKSKSKAIRSR